MTIETESSGETAGNQAVRQVSGPSRRPSGTSLGVAGRTEINCATSRSKCRNSKSPGEHLAQRNQLGNKARLGASTSRARAKVWAQLPGGQPGFGGPAQGLGWGVQGLGAQAHGGLGPRPSGAWAWAACDQFFVVLKSLDRGLAKGWESAE